MVPILVHDLHKMLHFVRDMLGNEIDFIKDGNTGGG